MVEMEEEEEVKVLEEVDPIRQESLSCEVELDPMEGDQTWPTEEEEEKGVLVLARMTAIHACCPAILLCVSTATHKLQQKEVEDYTSAWIREEEEEEEEESDEEDVPVISESDEEYETLVCSYMYIMCVWV